MHSIDLKNFELHSDLIIETNKDIEKDSYQENNITVDYIHLDKGNVLKKEAGDYITISFLDITDETNYDNVLKIFEKEIKRIIKLSNIKDNDKCLIIGLGNKKSTPDSLGHEVLNNITVTRFLEELNALDSSF